MTTCRHYAIRHFGTASDPKRLGYLAATGSGQTFTVRSGVATFSDRPAAEAALLAAERHLEGHRLGSVPYETLADLGRRAGLATLHVRELETCAPRRAHDIFQAALDDCRPGLLVLSDPDAAAEGAQRTFGSWSEAR